MQFVVERRESSVRLPVDSEPAGIALDAAGGVVEPLVVLESVGEQNSAPVEPDDWFLCSELQCILRRSLCTVFGG